MPPGGSRLAVEVHALTTYLLDTNHCSRIILGDTALLARLRTAGSFSVATCAVVAGELTLMAAYSGRKAENMPLFRRFLSTIPVFPLDAEDAYVYGELKADLLKHYGPKSGKKARSVKIGDIGFTDNDVWIAAAALSHDAVVVSADSDFQRMLSVRAL